MLRSLLVVALTVGFVSASHATDCSPTTSVCTTPNYLAAFPEHRQLPGDCPAQNDYVIHCLEVGTPPAPVSIDCAFVGSGFQCTSWPQGDALRYVWSGVPSSPLNPRDETRPDLYADCRVLGAGLHNLTLTVHGPNGESATGGISLTCPANDTRQRGG